MRHSKTDYTDLDFVLSEKEMRRLERRNTKSKKGSLLSSAPPKEDNNIYSLPSTSRKVEVKGLTQKQNTLINCIKQYDQVITLGSAGTGKTYIPAAIAAQLLQNKTINKIIITRPNVACGPTLGLLPGEAMDKFTPWVMPILSVLEDKLGKGAVECHIKKGNIELVPIEFIRGRTFDHAFVIVDEAQNCDLDILKALVTRIGEGSKLVVNGDVKQIDLKRGSGLQSLVDVATRSIHLAGKIGIVEFTKEDCVRSDICRDWLYAFDETNI